MTVTAALMAAKKAKGMSFADLEAAMGLDEAVSYTHLTLPTNREV